MLTFDLGEGKKLTSAQSNLINTGRSKEEEYSLFRFSGHINKDCMLVKLVFRNRLCLLLHHLFGLKST